MNKIKYFMLAMMAFVASASFTACSSDDDNNKNSGKQSNYEEYQKAVNQTVNSQKKSDKVILLVAFGSTWEQAYDTFDKVVDEYKSAFSGWDVYLSFSSAICINNARKGENVAPKDYYDPEHWLTAIGLAGYKQIVVQSLQVIPGEEYRIVAFMGHGNPEGYDYYGGNVRYIQLEEYLRAISPKYYVGTVDMDETYAEDVLKHIAGGKFDYKIGDVTKSVTYAANDADKAQLFVLMSIAGDHAHNDMADPEDDESWYSLFNEAGIETKAYETNFTEACWKQYKSGDEYIPGLAERSAVRKLWMNHTTAAIAKLGTDEALSTPTTAAE